MEKFISTESKNSLLKLGLYQFVCGVVGVCKFIWTIIQTERLYAASMILATVIIGLCIYSIYAGYACIKMTENALKHSFVNQGVQILGFNIAGFAFSYNSGIYLNIGLNMTSSFKFMFLTGISNVQLSLFQDTKYVIVGINLIALALFAWVDRINNKTKAEQELRKDKRFL